MRKALLLPCLVSLPLLCPAQSAPPTARLYAGAALAVLSGQPFNDYATTRLCPALTVGAQLTPRLALQLGSTYNQRHDVYHGSYPVNGDLVVEDADTRYRFLTLPLLLRTTLTNPASRWQLDALAGPTFEVYFSQQESRQTYRGQTTRSDNSNSTGTQVSLSLGPSVRYTLTPHLELTASALANLNLSGLPYTFAAPLSSQLYSHALAGLQYRFGH